ncbi:glyoxalase [Lentzea guizhouensis]|uniref:Glyoxalase n=1 Tax=Lentzea guizhouensis TaxID=1586287 RepID=A0A1B2HVQ1_9PSEU|nr:VOC family protein [Lentzea guizhouensis]ANZ41804.1 glyoxalase [Lentzea guizhouensis]
MKKLAEIDQKLEVTVIPVSDVERAKEFYRSLGWREDVTPPRVVQFTPPGSNASVHFGEGVTPAQPGSARHFLIVSDIVEAHRALVEAGAPVGDLFHGGPDGPVKGADPERRSYVTRAELADPDGNTWVLQEVTTRLPGRVDADDTSYASIADLEAALIRAAKAHGEHEARNGGVHDEQWPAWYAEYMVKEQTGAELPQ